MRFNIEAGGAKLSPFKEDVCLVNCMEGCLFEELLCRLEFFRGNSLGS